MNCKELQTISGALLEGEAHPEAYTHLASCLPCRLLLDELGAIERAARSLPDQEPSEGLWARIEAAAVAEGLRPQAADWHWFGWGGNWLPARAAFAGALAVMVLVAVGLVSYPHLELPVAETEPTDPIADPIQVAQGELVREASYVSRYQMHLNHVENRVLDEGAPVDAGLRELVAGPMEAVDRAIEQTQLQLNSYPDDLLTREELHRLYQQKAAVLQAVAESSWYEDVR